MALLESYSEAPPPRRRQTKVPAHWSYTASTGPPRDGAHAVVVYRLAVARLGVEDLTNYVAQQCGAAEALRWQRARAREYVTRLREQLRLHVGGAELIVHAEEGSAEDRVQVIATARAGTADEAARLEREIAERVGAVAMRTRASWLEGLRLTMATLQALEEPLV